MNDHAASHQIGHPAPPTSAVGLRFAITIISNGQYPTDHRTSASQAPPGELLRTCCIRPTSQRCSSFVATFADLRQRQPEMAPRGQPIKASRPLLFIKLKNFHPLLTVHQTSKQIGNTRLSLQAFQVVSSHKFEGYAEVLVASSLPCLKGLLLLMANGHPKNRETSSAKRLDGDTMAGESTMSLGGSN